MRSILVIVLLFFSNASFAAKPETTTYFSKTASNALEMRSLRRAGVGIVAAGPLGLGGLMLDLNFSPQWTSQIGFGGGPKYQAYYLGIKRPFSGEWLLPYVSVGFAHWDSLGRVEGGLQSTTPGYLWDRLMSAKQRSEQKINENLLTPTFGLEMYQLQGRWAGWSFDAQITVLLDILDFEAAITGGVGLKYYF